MVVRKILKFFSPRSIKFSASAKGCGAENYEKFFLQGQANFPPQPSVVVRKNLNFFFQCSLKFPPQTTMVVRKILKFFSPRPIKFSASAKCCGAENFEIFFFSMTKISASGNHDGAEHFEKFFLQGQANFLPQLSVVVRQNLN